MDGEFPEAIQKSCPQTLNRNKLFVSDKQCIVHSKGENQGFQIDF